MTQGFPGTYIVQYAKICINFSLDKPFYQLISQFQFFPHITNMYGLSMSKKTKNIP